MQTELLMIGTELLLGQVEDTNAGYLARSLATAGVDLYWKTTVGDNASRINDALQLGLSRSDTILCSGGLGPTADDITRDCVAQVLDMPLDEIIGETILGMREVAGSIGLLGTQA